MGKIRVLFVCVYNSFRSQIAEKFLNSEYGDMFVAESAGLQTKEINPLAIHVMSEINLDISKNSSDSVFDFYKQGRLYHHVITVCSREAEEKCPVFPGIQKRIHWDLPDPEEFEGTPEEKLEKARQLRDQIRNRVRGFVIEATHLSKEK
ncbi:MAG: arsenate reductase ArsC [Erysipelotrichaceae bacterium]|nr:arsenate reductase ArsC [Erysipelotrichaceae bacterium]MDP3306459.1 arsenate reductase ArsC [Erysipelotrichaceae bacterium]